MFSFEILPKKDIKIDSWRFIKDQVMGGKSDGFMLLKESQNQEFDFISAKGNVSTDGGGFLMFRKEIDNNSLDNFSSRADCSTFSNEELIDSSIRDLNSLIDLPSLGLFSAGALDSRDIKDERIPFLPRYSIFRELRES